MSDKEVTQILEWESTEGIKRSLLIVKTTDKKTIEISEYSSDMGKWQTVEVVDSINEIESFGIPKSLVD